MWPGGRPFIQQMNAPEDDGPNLEVIRRLFSSDVRGVPDDRAGQGLISERLLSLEDAADLLDSLVYPGRQPAAAERWDRVEEQVDISGRDPRCPLYRGPRGEEDVFVGLSPFDLAAYFRTWAVLLERRAPGFFSTDDPPLQWSLIDLADRRRRAPSFRVALRFGSGPIVGQVR